MTKALNPDLSQQMIAWRRELIDFSKRNRLLNLRTKSTSIKLIEPSSTVIVQKLLGLASQKRALSLQILAEHFVEESEQELFGESFDLDEEVEVVKASKKSVVQPLLENQVRSSTTDQSRLLANLRTLSRRADQEFLDKGIRILYLAVGALNWRENGEEWSGPILLFPVLLRKLPSSIYEVISNDEEDVALNPALVEKIRQDHEIDLNVEVDEDDPLAALSELAKLIEDKPEFSISEYCEISVFSFAKDVMYRDLLANEAQIVTSELVQALALGGLSESRFGFDAVKPEHLDEVAPPSKLMSILDADSTQRAAIVAAREGKSFVLDGPPGTGKSQTIANIIAELISAGRSVLFVSEKAAALEVVQSRLEASGLGTFLLPLHSQKVSRKDFAATLAKARAERAIAGRELSNAEISRLNKNQRKLSAYSNALNEVRDPLGISLYDAIGQHAGFSGVADAPVPSPSKDEGLKSVAGDFQTLTPSELLEIEDGASRLSRAWTQVEDPGEFFWRGIASPREAELQFAEIKGMLSRAKRALQDVHQTALNLAEDTGIPYESTLPSLRQLGQIVDFTADERHLVPEQWLVESGWSSVQARIVKVLDGVTDVQKRVQEAGELDPTWLVRPSEMFDELQGLVTACRRISCPVPDEFQEVTSINQLARNFEELANIIQELLDLGSRLAAKLGDKPQDLTTARLEILCKAADLASAAHRPESIWFTATGLTAAQDALEEIEPLIAKYRSRFNEVEKFFKAEIADFPIEKIFASDGLTPILSSFSGVGRSNKKSLATLTKSGKLGKEEKAQLVELLTLAQLRTSIESNEQVKKKLGSQYFKGIETDFEAITSALASARTALVLLDEANSEQLAAALSRAAIDATETAELGQRIQFLVSRFTALRTSIRKSKYSGDFLLVKEQALAIDFAKCLDQLHDKFEEFWGEEVGLTIGEGLRRAQQIQSTKEALLAFQARSEVDRQLLGDFYGDLETDAEQALTAMNWAGQLREFIGLSMNVRLASRLCTDKLANAGTLSRPVEEYSDSTQGIIALFASDRAAELTEILEFDVQTALAYLEDLINNVEQIKEEVNFQESMSLLKSFGLASVLNFIVDSQVAANEIAPMVKKAVLAAWIESVIASDRDVLEPLEKINRDQLVTDFVAGDKKLRLHASALVSKAANEHRPTAVLGSIGVINTQAAMKRKHMRISELLSRVSDVATAIKPCFMMSPLSVSTFLPADFRFDAVIFDEASQLTSANAVNAIYRGNQVIVAGDENQLRPSSHFAASLKDDDADEYFDDDVAEFDSLLKQAKSGGFQEIGLKWHYRSRHESLITYSNYSFYEGELVTYPGSFQESESLGVQFIHVPDGVYGRSGRRTNVIEAQKVVERVFHHATHNPTLSVGVVAFSLAQATEIENQLEIARRERPDLESYFVQDRLHGFFVKNLENVQGDERDIIIFSVGYGRDEHGKLTMNFGPVNPKEDGWRRLNVAFTRARNRVELVSSITGADFTGNNTNINHLKRYFEYAEKGMVALAAEVDVVAGGPESPFEEEVLRTINAWGYKVTPQVGQAGYRIDMAISDPARPGEFVLGIECDGAAYHGSKVARDRDRLRQEVLEGLGWTLYRIWGPTWYRSPANAKSDLKAAIDAALERGPKREVVSEVATEVVEHSVYEAEPDESSRFVAEYWPLRPIAYRLKRNYSVDELSRFVFDTVETEGPISRNLLRRRAANAMGSHLTPTLKADVDERIDAHIKAKKLVGVDFDALSTKERAGLLVARRPDERDELTKRQPSDVPFMEVVAAVAHAVELGHSVEVSEIEDQVVRRIFGFERVTAPWKDLIMRAIEDLLQDSWCTWDEGRLCKSVEFPDLD